MKLQSLHQFLYDKLLRQTIHVDLIQIVFDLALAAKLIGYNISRNKLLEVGRGNSGSNYTIKQPHPLNVLAGDIFKSYLEKSGQVICRLSSEISTKAVKDDKMQKASYTAFINPLDYDHPVDDLDSPGSIFSLYPHLDNRAAIKTGRIQKLAGYFLYGSTITLVLTLGEGVHVFSYDSHIGEFLLTQKNLKISKDATAYYLQKERQEEFPVEIQKYLNAIKSCQREDGSRYIRITKPSLILSMHQCLTRGGIVLYPQTKKYPHGSLSQMYCCNPMAYIIEQAGGLAIDGMQPLLDKPVKNNNPYAPFIAGSYQMVKSVLEFYKNKSLSIHSIYCC